MRLSLKVTHVRHLSLTETCHRCSLPSAGIFVCSVNCSKVRSCAIVDAASLPHRRGYWHPHHSKDVPSVSGRNAVTGRSLLSAISQTPKAGTSPSTPSFGVRRPVAAFGFFGSATTANELGATHNHPCFVYFVVIRFRRCRIRR